MILYQRSSTNKRRCKDYFDCQSYLKKFWPEDPKNSVWEDNRWLLEEYLVSAKIISAQRKRKWKKLDISTGPTLGPLLPFVPVISALQLTDYSATNREILQEMRIDYWHKYTELIIRMEGKEPSKQRVSRRLRKLDELLRERDPVKVDIARKSLFTPPIDTSRYDLFTMHFVPDSITKTKERYYQLLSNVFGIIKPTNILVMSALIGCTVWDDGVNPYPSPNIALNEILAFLRKNDFLVLRAKQFFSEKPEGHDGGIAVITSICI